MSLSTFRINQPPGSGYSFWDRARRDLVLGSVEGEAQNKSQTTYKWEMASAPEGVSVTINNSTTHTCNFTLATKGGYLLRLTVNEGLPAQSISTWYLAVALTNTGLCLPAMDETTQDNSQSPYDGSRGWIDKTSAFLSKIDENTVVENLKTSGASGYVPTSNGAGALTMQSPVVSRTASPAYVRPSTDGDTLRSYSGSAYGELSSTAVSFSGTGSISSGSSSDLAIGARGASINLNSATDTSLVGFTKTSVIGALNELKSEIAGSGGWTRVTGPPAYLRPTADGDAIRAYNGANYSELTYNSLRYAAHTHASTEQCGQIAHGDLTGIGSNTHAQIDTHISSTSNPHATSIANLGSGTFAQLDAAVTDASLWAQDTDIKIKFYSQATEPTLGDQRAAWWEDTTGGGTYLVFKKPGGAQVSVELA